MYKMFLLCYPHPIYWPLKSAEKWSYPNCHWSMFEDFIFWKKVFKNLENKYFFRTYIFLIFFRKFCEYFSKIFLKFLEKWFKKNSENLIFKNWFVSVGIRLTVFWNSRIYKVWHQLLLLRISGQKSLWVLSFKRIKCFFWVIHNPVTGLWKWPKNDHIVTSINHSKISFCEK